MSQTIYKSPSGINILFCLINLYDGIELLSYIMNFGYKHFEDNA